MNRIANSINALTCHTQHTTHVHTPSLKTHTRITHSTRSPAHAHSYAAILLQSIVISNHSTHFKIGVEDLSKAPTHRTKGREDFPITREDLQIVRSIKIHQDQSKPESILDRHLSSRPGPAMHRAAPMFASPFGAAPFQSNRSDVDDRCEHHDRHDTMSSVPEKRPGERGGGEECPDHEQFKEATVATGEERLGGRVAAFIHNVDTSDDGDDSDDDIQPSFKRDRRFIPIHTTRDNETVRNVELTQTMRREHSTAPNNQDLAVSTHSYPIRTSGLSQLLEHSSEDTSLCGTSLCGPDGIDVLFPSNRVSVPSGAGPMQQRQRLGSHERRMGLGFDTSYRHRDNLQGLLDEAQCGATTTLRELLESELARESRSSKRYDCIGRHSANS